MMSHIAPLSRYKMRLRQVLDDSELVWTSGLSTVEIFNRLPEL